MKDIFLNYLVQYIEFCKGQFQWDVEWFSEPWMYIPMFVPVTFFFVFFVIKWVVITMPLWIPFRVMMKGPMWPMMNRITTKRKLQKEVLKQFKED